MFLDCVRHILTQHPVSFEFNEEFLLLIAEHSYSSEFGTFLFNNEQQRHQSGLREKTTSLWSYTNREEVLRSIQNPLYEHNKEVIIPCVAPQSLTVWTNLFMRSDTNQLKQSKESMHDMMWTMKQENIQLKNRAKELHEEFRRLQTSVLDEISVSQVAAN